MKNLKKVLALVLVVATICGFMTIAGAKDFADADSISHKEAVDVMSLIKVINGKGNNTFDPKGNVTRAEMAKMIAVILNSGEDVNKLYAGTNPFTDCVGHWAEGSIAFAASEDKNIVAGIGGGKFNPDGNVTGVEAAKMLLCALGYDAKVESYTGSKWAVNTLSDARQAGLLKDLSGVDMNAPLSRDNAAQMMFNALTADTVEYLIKGGSITINNNVINTAASPATKIENKNSDYRLTTKPTASQDQIEQLVEVYYPGLKYRTTSADDPEGFDRTGHKWTYKNEEVGAYLDAPALIYTAETGEKTIKSDLGTISAQGTATYAGYLASDSAVSVSITASDDTAAKVAAKLAALTGNGTVVEIYKNADDTAVTHVVVIESAVGVLSTKDTKATNAKGAYTKYSITAESGYVGKSGILYTSHVDADEEEDTVILHGSVAKDDVVTYYVDGEGMLHIFPTTEVSGLLTLKSKDDESLTIAGTKYDVAANDSSDTYTANSKDSQSFALDRFGYVVKVTTAADPTLYGMVLREDSYFSSDSGRVKKVPAVQIVTADGKVEQIDVVSEDENTPAGTVVSYKLNSKGVYKLTAVSTTYNATTGRATAITGIAKATSAFTTDGGSQNVPRANNNTLYVFVNYTGSGSDREVAGTVTTYTGYRNMDAYGNNDPLVKSTALDTDSDIDHIANVVFVYDDVKAEDTTKFVYLTGNHTTDAARGDVYEAIIKGLEAELVVNADATPASGGMYKTLTIQADGTFDVTAPNAGDTKTTSVKIDGGVVTLTSDDFSAGTDALASTGTEAILDLADDAHVYIIDATSGPAKATGWEVENAETAKIEEADVDYTTTDNGIGVEVDVYGELSSGKITVLYIVLSKTTTPS